jgi:hypothetical protein
MRGLEEFGAVRGLDKIFSLLGVVRTVELSLRDFDLTECLAGRARACPEPVEGTPVATSELAALKRMRHSRGRWRKSPLLAKNVRNGGHTAKDFPWKSFTKPLVRANVNIFLFSNLPATYIFVHATLQVQNVPVGTLRRRDREWKSRGPSTHCFFASEEALSLRMTMDLCRERTTVWIGREIISGNLRAASRKIYPNRSR